MVLRLILLPLVVVACAPGVSPQTRQLAHMLGDQAKLEMKANPRLGKREAIQLAHAKLKRDPAFMKLAAAAKQSQAPSGHEVQTDPHWINGGVKARWVYFPAPPSNYGAAEWHQLTRDYKYPKEGIKQMPYLKYANGPGSLTFYRKEISLGNMFTPTNSLLQVDGDWKDGRLVRAVRVQGAEELAKRDYSFARNVLAGGLGLLAVGVVKTGEFAADAMREGAASGGSSSSSGSSTTGAGSTDDGGEVDRFKRHFQGRTASFVVRHDDGGGFASSNDLLLEDAATGKKFSVAYTHGLSDGIGGGRSLEGQRVEIRFGGDGTPLSIKSLANGRSFDLDGWRATGFGW